MLLPLLLTIGFRSQGFKSSFCNWLRFCLAPAISFVYIQVWWKTTVHNQHIWTFWYTFFNSYYNSVLFLFSWNHWKVRLQTSSEAHRFCEFRRPRVPGTSSLSGMDCSHNQHALWKLKQFFRLKCRTGSNPKSWHWHGCQRASSECCFAFAKTFYELKTLELSIFTLQATCHLLL